MMPDQFPYDVFLSHSAKDKAVVRPLAERLREAGLRLWFDEWEMPVAASRPSAAFSAGGQTREEEDGGALPRRRYAEKIEDGPGKFGTRNSKCGLPRLCLSAHAFGSDGAQLEAGTFGWVNLLEPQLAVSRPAEPGAPLHSPAARRPSKMF